MSESFQEAMDRAASKPPYHHKKWLMRNVPGLRDALRNEDISVRVIVDELRARGYEVRWRTVYRWAREERGATVS